MADVPSLRFEVSGQEHAHQFSLAAPDVLPPPACLGCQRLEKRLDAATIDLENAEVSLRGERRRYANLLKKFQELEHGLTPHESVDEIFKVWKVFCRPKARAVGPKRRTAVGARLREGSSHADFATAIVGAAAYPYQRDGTIYDDLELIARDQTNMDAFIQKGHHAHRVHADTGVAPWEWRIHQEFRLTPDDLRGQAVQRKMVDILLERVVLLKNLRDMDVRAD